MNQPRRPVAASLPTLAALAGLAGLSIGAAACASAGGTAPDAGPASSPAADAAGSEYVRVIDAIEVRDEHGTPYPFPFLGGFDVPRPQFVDIDADGDLDLFVQERGNALIHFENIGTPQSARFEWRTDAYRGLEIGEWTRFADLDGDGDYDVLGEEMFSYVRVYRNGGTPQRAEFVLAADSLRDPAGKPVFADRQNIPALVDWDCDGDLDLFIGRVDGTVTRYEEAGLDSNGIPTFRFVTDRFEEIEIVGQLGSRHGANSMAFADMDGDGALDLFWGDFFEPGVLFLENRGSCTNPSLRVEPVPARTADTLETSGYNAPYLADIDADGDLDLFVGVIGGAFNPTRTAADNFLYLENDGTGLFTQRSARYVPGIDVGSESIPEVGDLDGDGDLDILLGNKVDPDVLMAARLYWFENTGDSSRPAFRLADTLDLGEFYHYAPALGDLDGDGADDMLLGTWNKGVFLYRNAAGGDGSPRFEQVLDTAFIKLTRGSNSVPALGDVDGDGDLDLFVGESSGELNFYLNTGTPSAAEFSLVSDNYEEIDVGRRSSPELADIDGDGDLDLVIGSESGALTLMRNETVPGGDARFVLDVEFGVPLQPASAPVFADIDGDGDLDLLVGGLAGGLVLMENAGSD